MLSQQNMIKKSHFTFFIFICIILVEVIYMSTRMPIQKRGIEKRDKIIKKGFELMCNNGYFNTNTNDIAKYSEVSTGILYQYFNDKKEIFIEGYKEYSNSIMFPIIDVIKNNLLDLDNMDKLLDQLLNIFILKHTLSKKAHEEMIAMVHLDDDVAKIYRENEINTTNMIVKILENNGKKIKNINEKVHIIIGIIENYCHEIVYHKHNSINYDDMKNEVINIVNYLLK